MSSCKNSIAKRQHGFTIVELLVVMVVIGILAAISLVSYNGVTKKAIESSLASDLSNFKKQLEMHYIENDIFPSEIKCPAENINQICLETNDGTEISLVKVGEGTSDFLLSASKADVVMVATRNTQAKIPSPIQVEFTGNQTEKEVEGYKILEFNNDGTFKITDGDDINSIEVLVVAGGGGGASKANAGGTGGGGGGGVIHKGSYAVILSEPIDVKVGLGGPAGPVGTNASGTNGTNSIFGGLSAIGGGGGGTSSSNGKSGGSGGGGGYNGYNIVRFGGDGTVGQGNKGGDTEELASAGGAGGGGAGSNGFPNRTVHAGGLGGDGLTYSISGVPVTYSAGGAGGGGAIPRGAGVEGTGKGGDAVYGNSSNPSYNGASGTVIVKYKK